MTCLFEYGIFACQFQNAHVVYTDDSFEILFVEQLLGRDFVESHLLIYDFIVSVEIGAQHVDATFNLLDDLLHCLAV